jgi:hypothetical protein
MDSPQAVARATDGADGRSEHEDVDSQLRLDEDAALGPGEPPIAARQSDEAIAVANAAVLRVCQTHTELFGAGRHGCPYAASCTRESVSRANGHSPLIVSARPSIRIVRFIDGRPPSTCSSALASPTVSSRSTGENTNRVNAEAESWARMTMRERYTAFVCAIAYCI